jgi:hypothetical protein
MPNSADALRRWFGLFFLAVAFGMLIWGQTVFRTRLEQHLKWFVFYWCGCFMMTGAAIFTALIDMRATRKRARAEHDDLVQRTLEEIERESGKTPDE